MFILVTINKTLRLEPKDLGKNMRTVLQKKLNRVTKGTCSSKWKCFIIDIIQIKETGDGIVQDTTGDVLFDVKF